MKSLRLAADGLSLEVVGFYKWMSGLAVRDPTPTPKLAEALLQEGVGRAYGVQMLLRQEAVGTGSSGGSRHTMSHSERQDTPGSNWRLFDYDQPHALTVVGSKELGAWTLGARFRYATGLPRTPVAGAFYDAKDDVYQPGLRGAGIRFASQIFWQLDLRIDRSFPLGESARILVYVEGLNVTNRANGEEYIYNVDHYPGAGPQLRGAPDDRGARREGRPVTRPVSSSARRLAGRGGLAVGFVAIASSATRIPNLGPGDSIVTSTRVLAVRAVPPEAKPGATVTFTAFVVGPSGAIAEAPDRLGLLHRAAPSHRRQRRLECVPRFGLAHRRRLRNRDDRGDSPERMLALWPRQPPRGGFRPADPDATGGYYQPLRVALSDTDARRSPSPGFNATSRTPLPRPRALLPGNTRLTTPRRSARSGAQSTVSPSLSPPFPRARAWSWSASWAPQSAGNVRLLLDPVPQSVTTQRESLQVAWYATAGAFESGIQRPRLGPTLLRRPPTPGPPSRPWVLASLRRPARPAAAASISQP